MMSIMTRRELSAELATQYRQAPGNKEKRRILDAFMAATGYHPKYAIRLLNHPPQPRVMGRRRRARYYPTEVQQVLFQLWDIANRICSKRLVPFLPELIAALERHGELSFSSTTRALLLSISPATVDRTLHFWRQRSKGKGRATTKPGSILKASIPIRTHADWDDAVPGFTEADLVAHCGESAGGEYLHSLVLTDVSTAWTECIALLNRSQYQVTSGIDEVRSLLPFPLKGLDSDNGTEFINDHLFRYCQANHILFTRCRPYKKNDQAHVEQKNWTVVRQTVGYGRLEGEEALRLLQALYVPLRLYMNFFQPVAKLIRKERIGNKVRKHYDEARTPYRRVLQSDHVSIEVKERLQAQYSTLNPAALHRTMRQLLKRLHGYE